MKSNLFKFIVIALVANSLLLVLLEYDDGELLFPSIVNFSITIHEAPAQASNARPSKPQLLSPTNGLHTTSPILLQASSFEHPGFTHMKSEWFVRRSEQEFPQSSFYAEIASPSFTNLAVPADILLPNATYFWKVRYLSSNNTWSDFSDEASFRIISPVTSGGGSVFQPAIPAKKDFDGPPVEIQLQKRTLKKGKPLKLNIRNKKLTQKSRKAKEVSKVHIEIKKKNGKTVLQKEELFRRDKKTSKKTIQDTQQLGIGSYEIFARYREGFTNVLFAQDFDVVPFNLLERRLSAVVFWMEWILTVLFTVSIFLFRSRRKKHTL